MLRPSAPRFSSVRHSDEAHRTLQWSSRDLSEGTEHPKLTESITYMYGICGTLIKSGNALELCVGSRTFSDFREKLTLKNAAVPPNVLMSRSQLKCHNDYCQFTENNLHFLLHFRSNFHRRSPLQVEGTARKCFQCFAATGSLNEKDV